MESVQTIGAARPVASAAELSAPPWFAEMRAAVDAALAEHFRARFSEQRPHSRLLESVEYSTRLGGKRLRPVLVLEAGRACGKSPAAAMPAALAIEMIHTFSLVHDDLPAMDDDDLRRGHPTNHKVFGEAAAILAGDWLVTHAFELAALGGFSPAATGRIVAELSQGTKDMIVGQAADMAGQSAATSPELVEFIHLHKTARLIETSCRVGALAADATDDAVEALGRFGRRLGLAFQIVDDLLDCTASTEQLGKRAGKDANVSKQTFTAAFGVEASRRRAVAEARGACEALAAFGERAGRLRELAEFVVSRDR